jgi:hypothetical protein
MSMDQQLYLIRVRNSKMVKCGLSNTPPARLKQLQTGCPFELEFCGTIKPNCEPAAFERGIHEMFADRRKLGEWFQLDDSDLDLMAALFNR